jgi:hypothetical protein
VYLFVAVDVCIPVDAARAGQQTQVLPLTPMWVCCESCFCSCSSHTACRRASKLTPCNSAILLLCYIKKTFRCVQQTNTSILNRSAYQFFNGIQLDGTGMFWQLFFAA